MSGKAPPRGPRALVGPEMGSSPPSRPPPTGPRSLSSTNNNAKAVNGRHNPPCDADDSLAAGRQSIAFAFTSKPTFTPRAVASKTRENIPQPQQPPPPSYDPPPPSEPPPPPPPSEPPSETLLQPPKQTRHTPPRPALDPPPPLPQPQPIHSPYTIHMTKKHPALRTPTTPKVLDLDATTPSSSQPPVSPTAVPRTCLNNVGFHWQPLLYVLDLDALMDWCAFDIFSASIFCILQATVIEQAPMDVVVPILYSTSKTSTRSSYMLGSTHVSCDWDKPLD
ncbi:hypothetical protein C8J57DRAFT_1543732 [Mycena rebaudengoi]|nr:hypothetical protein C8J57DRAFT_1543732 [Mycena rebaudengoi]